MSKHAMVLTCLFVALIGGKVQGGAVTMNSAATGKFEQTLYFGGDIITMEGDAPTYAVQTIVDSKANRFSTTGGTRATRFTSILPAIWRLQSI